MELEKKSLNGKYIYNVTGRVDTQTAPDLQDVFEEDLNNYEQKQEQVQIVLNLQNVEYLSSAGLRAVLYVKKRLDAFENNSSLLIVNEKPEVKEIFEMTGFTDFLSFGLLDESGNITENTEVSENSENS